MYSKAHGKYQTLVHGSLVGPGGVPLWKVGLQIVIPHGTVETQHRHSAHRYLRRCPNCECLRS